MKKALREKTVTHYAVILLQSNLLHNIKIIKHVTCFNVHINYNANETALIPHSNFL